MKITVDDDKQDMPDKSPTISIKDSDNGLEKVTVRAVTFKTLADRRREAEEALKKKQRVWRRTFRKLWSSTFQQQTEARTDPQSPASDNVKTIEIKLILPSLTKLLTRENLATAVTKAKEWWANSSTKTRTTTLGAVVIVIIGFSLLPKRHPFVPHIPDNTNGAASAATPTLTKGMPTYATVIPAGATIKQLGGWTRVSPPGRNPVYAYVDKIGAVQIDVSEQPLPTSFQRNTDKQVAQLAQNFKATEKIPTSSSPIYIATFADDTQSVIFTKNQLLILMKSASLLPPTTWASYAESLTSIQPGTPTKQNVQ